MDNFLNKAIEINPDTIVSIAYVDRGKCYLAIGENEKALQDFNKAIETISFDGRAYYYRGLCYQKLGDEEKAQLRRYLELFDKLSPAALKPYYEAIGKQFYAWVKTVA